jgi:hypothetical protein
MSRRLLIGIFESEHDILKAAEIARSQGMRIVDVFAPYAVHGLDRAMGLTPSRLPWVCFALGLFGAGFKVWFEYWTTAFNWPINVGGKPWNSLPAFVPITFEVMVLFAGVSTVIAFFLVSRLRPGRKAQIAFPGTTDHRFALVIEETAYFDAPTVRRFFEGSRAVQIGEHMEQEVA